MEGGQQMSTTPRTDEVYNRQFAPEKPGITWYELSKQLETELAATSIIAEKWEADALRYAKNAEYWQSRAEKAEAALAAAVDGVIDGGNSREKMLYIHVPGDARGHMMGQLVKVILPAIDAAMKETSK
jgi:hypothetical protein